MFGAAIAVFTGASVLCALSGSLAAFTAARILQGIGGALMLGHWLGEAVPVPAPTRGPRGS